MTRNQLIVLICVVLGAGVIFGLIIIAGVLDNASGAVVHGAGLGVWADTHAGHAAQAAQARFTELFR
jgi:hypothetical protein